MCLNKTGSQNIRIVIYLRWHDHCVSRYRFRKSVGVMLSWLLPSLLIRCPIVSPIITLLFRWCIPFIWTMVFFPWILRCLYVSVMFIFTRSTVTNWIHGFSSVFSWDTLLHKKVTSVSSTHSKYYVSMDIEFQEHTSYFLKMFPILPFMGSIQLVKVGIWSTWSLVIIWKKKYEKK